MKAFAAKIKTYMVDRLRKPKVPKPSLKPLVDESHGTFWACDICGKSMEAPSALRHTHPTDDALEQLDLCSDCVPPTKSKDKCNTLTEFITYSASILNKNNPVAAAARSAWLKRLESSRTQGWVKDPLSIQGHQDRVRAAFIAGPSRRQVYI